MIDNTDVDAQFQRGGADGRSPDGRRFALSVCLRGAEYRRQSVLGP